MRGSKGARGHEVLYICATDEHGTPAELAAAKAGQDVRAYCDEQHQIQKDAGDKFGLSYNWFGRSSSPENHQLTQAFCEALDKNGLIEERVDKMVFSIDDGRFLPDRYVEGTCPHCGYDKARGDQCDNCGRLLDPTDLINPYSAVSGSRNLEVRDTRHLYLLQTKVEPQLRQWIAGKAEWPQLALSIANKHLEEGLIDRGITRDLKWGIPVTKDGNRARGSRTKSSMSGSMPRSNISAPRKSISPLRVTLMAGKHGGATTRAPRTCAMSNSWARTMSPSIRSASRRPSWARVSRGKWSIR